jgi:hypothetical protein
LCSSPYSSRLCWTAGLRHEFVELALRKRVRADDYLLHGESDQHKLRCKQHTELGGSRSDKSCHHAGDIHVHIGERFNDDEPDGHNHLHADSDQCHRRGHVYANRHRKHDRQTNNHFFHG